MLQVSVDKAQSKLLDLINAALRGEKVWIITDKQQAVELVPAQKPTHHRQFGSAKGLIAMNDDFDAPLPDFAEYAEQGKRSQPYPAHEPDEELLSADDAFRDADLSEARWQAFEQERRLRRVVIELQEPAYGALEELARRQDQTVSRSVEEVINQLLATFAPGGALESHSALRDRPASYDVVKPAT